MIKRDVVVVGAGSSGAAAAAGLAALGLDVMVVESRPLLEAGADWYNTVPPWMLDLAGIPRPLPPETVGGPHAAHVEAADGSRRVTMDPAPLLELDMARLVRRLQSMARKAGARLVGDAEVTGVEVAGGRPRAVTVTRGGKTPRTETIRARLFVDASGRRGALRAAIPSWHQACPPPRRDEVCSAAQGVFDVTDAGAAEEFLEKNRLRPGDALSWTGGAGSFSTLTIRYHPEAGALGILAGSILDADPKGGHALLREFQRRQGWLGGERRLGAGLIPVRRPYACLAGPGMATLGDAACQVFPTHGSGVGPTLLAARALAEAVEGHRDPGSPEAMWDYQVRFHRGPGAVNAAYDMFRRMVQTCRPGDMKRLLDHGLVSRTATRAALEQRMTGPGDLDLAEAAIGALRVPSLAAHFVPRLAGMRLAYELARRFPATPSGPAMLRWERSMARLAGTPPDLSRPPGWWPGERSAAATPGPRLQSGH